MALSREVFSSVAASLIKILCLASMPVPTATAVGVARPRASGQAITTAEIAKVRAVKSVAPARKYPPKTAATPEPTATTTSQPAALSAIRWPGALEFWAVSTSLMICAKTVSAPTFTALNLTTPVTFTDPPTTLSPLFLATGKDSPVTNDSSMEVDPSTTSPSTGTLSPGRTTTISSFTISELGILISLPLRITTALGGTKSNKARSASEV